MARRPRAAARAAAPTTPDPVEIAMEAARMNLSAADRAEVVRGLGVRAG